MASEITVTASLGFSKGGIAQTFAALSGVKFDLTGTKWTFVQANISTSEEALDYGDVASPGLFLMKNLDATNYVSLRSATGLADFAKVLPGDVCLCRLAVTTVQIQANTAACDVQYLLLEA